jgi:hypothetical protein
VKSVTVDVHKIDISTHMTLHERLDGTGFAEDHLEASTPASETANFHCVCRERLVVSYMGPRCVMRSNMLSTYN